MSLVSHLQETIQNELRGRDISKKSEILEANQRFDSLVQRGLVQPDSYSAISAKAARQVPATAHHRF